MRIPRPYVVVFMALLIVAFVHDVVAHALDTSDAVVSHVVLGLVAFSGGVVLGHVGRDLWRSRFPGDDD